MKNLEKMLHAITAAAQVEETRTFFKEILGMDQVCIGGSAALLCEHNIYLGREVHDIDVVLSQGQFDGVLSSLSALARYFDFKRKKGSSCYKDADGKIRQRSAAFVLKDGLEINILVGKHLEGQWQSIQEIINAKMRYGRPKDIRDLAIIFGK